MAPRPVETIKKKAIADTGLRANDVLLGRGSGPSPYECNRHFRKAKHFDGGAKLDRPVPKSLDTDIESRLCRIVQEKITRMDGRFLQKVASAEDTTHTEYSLCE
jgi:hypothetical protein